MKNRKMSYEHFQHSRNTLRSSCCIAHKLSSVDDDSSEKTIFCQLDYFHSQRKFSLCLRQAAELLVGRRQTPTKFPHFRIFYCCRLVESLPERRNLIKLGSFWCKWLYLGINERPHRAVFVPGKSNVGPAEFAFTNVWMTESRVLPKKPKITDEESIVFKTRCRVEIIKCQFCI